MFDIHEKLENWATGVENWATGDKRQTAVDNSLKAPEQMLSAFLYEVNFEPLSGVTKGKQYLHN